MKQWQADGDNTLYYTILNSMYLLSPRTHFGIHHTTRTTIDPYIDHTRPHQLFLAFHFFNTRDIANEEEADRSSRHVGRSSNDSYRTFLPSLYLFLSRGSPPILPQCGESLRMYLCSASLTPSPNGFLMRQHRRSRRSPPTITARGFLKGSH